MGTQNPVNNLSKLTEHDIDELSANLIQCILSNSLSDAKLLVKDLAVDIRKELTRKHPEVDINPAIFTAIKMGNLEFVRFLVKECHADIEERGIYRVEDDNSEHVVTPLWCAAVANKLDVVKLLVSLGSDVNATSDSGSTPVRSACYMTNVEVVKFLTENGGDLEIPNQTGGTCLINSVQDVDLCRFLIDQGVNVNARDSSGNLALHYAIKEGRFKTVQLLIERGSDPYLKNDHGDDALQCASLRGFTDIVDYLFATIKPNLVRQIESFQLLGGNFIDEKINVSEGLLMWEKAIDLMKAANHFGTLEIKTLSPNPVYDFAIEATTLKELTDVKRSRNSVFMQALLLREKILGPVHRDTMFGLMYRGAVYADTHDYGRCMRLWKYAFKLRHTSGNHLCHEYIFTLQALCKLFLEIYHEDLDISAKNGLTFDEVYEVLEMVTLSAGTLQGCNPDEVFEHQQEKLLSIMKLVLHLIALSIKLIRNEVSAFKFRKLVYALLSIGLRTTDGKTIFLLAVSRDTTSVGGEFYSAFPSVPVIQVLLECGAHVMEKDKKGNTALHLLEEDWKNRDIIKQIVNMLVVAGVHIDARNSDGIAANHLLTLDWMKIDFFAQTTLKCLAARVIRQWNLPYGEVLPQPLHEFVEMH